MFGFNYSRFKRAMAIPPKGRNNSLMLQVRHFRGCRPHHTDRRGQNSVQHAGRLASRPLYFGPSPDE